MRVCVRKGTAMDGGEGIVVQSGSDDHAVKV